MTIINHLAKKNRKPHKPLGDGAFRCHSCREFFPADKKSKGGRTAYCKKCAAQASAKSKIARQKRGTFRPPNRNPKEPARGD